MARKRSPGTAKTIRAGPVIPANDLRCCSSSWSGAGKAPFA
ncbi:MAG: hypothetical protein WAN78_06520 [Methanoregula sp.]